MLSLNGARWATGTGPLFIGHEIGHRRVTVAVSCTLADFKIMAFLDTGCSLSIVGGELAKELEPLLGAPIDHKRLDTRLGAFEGDVYRCPVVFEATDGQNCPVDVTLLLCEAWDGPTVLGFDNALDRIRFALDPASSSFDEPSWFFGLP